LKLVALFLIFLYTDIFANVISIDKYTQSIPILKDSSLYLDKNSTDNISDILKKEQIFTPFTKNFVNYGYIFKDTLWIKFTLKNNSESDILKYLVIDAPNIDILNLYFYKNNKLNSISSGIFNRKSFQNELAFSFPLKLKSQELVTYYLEIKATTHSLHFNLKINDYKTFKSDELHHQLILTIFFSILFVIMISNAVIFYNTKDSVYIYYSFFILSIFIHHLSIRGMIGYFLPANSEIITLQAYLPIYNLAVVLVAMFLFIRKFLNLYKYKKIYFIFKLLILLILSITVIHSKENYILNYLTPLALIFALYVEFIGFYLFRNTKEKNAKYFFIIWSISLSGMIGTMLYYVGILPSVIPYLLEITLVVEVLLFSMILANQIKTLQHEKLKKDKIILEQSKLSSMGEMLQNIAHQWRQPLSEINAVAMKIDADFYKKRLNALSLEKDIERIENITGHMSNTIEGFTSYFKQYEELDSTTFHYIIDKALNILHSSLKDITLSRTYEDNSNINVNISELIQVILIILNNAVEVLNLNKVKDKMIDIKITKLDTHPTLEITDNAGGIKKENLTKIFEPYFSTKFKSNGIGIGLYIAKTIIEDKLKGTLSVSNTQNGAKFTIQL